MFSEALAFLDKNTERYMVDFYADKAEAETVRAYKAWQRSGKRNCKTGCTGKLHLAGKDSGSRN